MRGVVTGSITSVRSRDTPPLFCSTNSPIISGLGVNHCAGCATSRDAFQDAGELIRTGEKRKLHQSPLYSSGDDDVNTGDARDTKDFPRGSTALCVSDLRENAERRARCPAVSGLSCAVTSSCTRL